MNFLDAPHCARQTIRSVHYIAGEPFQLDCPSVSDPSPLRFEWQLHFLNGSKIRQPVGSTPLSISGSSTSTSVVNSVLTTSLSPASLVLGDRGRAQLTLRPAHSIARAACWAQNELGTQQKPCYFNLIPAGKFLVKTS